MYNKKNKNLNNKIPNKSIFVLTPEKVLFQYFKLRFSNIYQEDVKRVEAIQFE